MSARPGSNFPSDTDGLLLQTLNFDHGDHSEPPSPVSVDTVTRHSHDSQASAESRDNVTSAAAANNAPVNNAPQTLPTRQAALPDPPRKKLKRGQRFRKLLFPGMVRWAITLLLMAAFWLSIWSYQERVISPTTKSAFDAITVGISIAFGLNIASSFKAIALDLRWWVLSIKRRASQEVDLILHCDSMTDLLRLVIVAPRPITVVACLSWVAINIAAQVGIAVLGLTYSADPGPEDIYRGPSSGSVAIADMNSFASTLGRFGELEARDDSFAAHILGDIGSSYNFSMLPDEPLANTPWASHPMAFWNATDHWEYLFLESAPGLSAPNFLSIYTDRVVISSAVCTTPPWRHNISGEVAILRVNGGETVVFPALAFGLELIYYLTTPISVANPPSNGSCGPGCSNIKVLEPATGPPFPGSLVSDNRYFYYECNITVKSSTPDMTLLPHNGAKAAQAIALSGQVHPELQRHSQGGTNQYVAYDFDVTFGEPQNNSVAGMASLLSRFAIGVIAAAAQTNPPLIVPGAQPMQGVRLTLGNAVGFYLILGLIGGLQLILVIVTAVLLRDLEIPEEILLSHEEEIRKRFVLG